MDPVRSPAALYEALDDLLTFGAAALDLIPTYADTAELAGAPESRFITAGLPAIDCCPGMWAYAGGLAEGPTSPARTSLDPGHRSGAYQRVNLPTLNLLVMRCTPTFKSDGSSEPPSSEQLAEVAAQVYADGWTLWSLISRAIKQDYLFTRCSEAFLDAAYPQDPQGGCAGWLMVMRVNIGGFDFPDGFVYPPVP